MDEGIVFPIVEVDVKYHQSARYDEVLLIKTYLRKVDRARLIFEYEVQFPKSPAPCLPRAARGEYLYGHAYRPDCAAAEGKN